MDRNFVILGAGGHARVVSSLIRTTRGAIYGCIALDPPAYGCGMVGIPWLGNDTVLNNLETSKIVLANGIGSVGDTGLRSKVYQNARAQGFHFPSICHPKAFVDPEVKLERGAQVMAGVVVQSGATIGENAVLNTGSLIDHDVEVGAHAHIAPGVTISGNVKIGEGAHVAVGATVIQGIIVGAGAVVAAGAVVIRDVPAGVTIAGIPGRPIEL